MIDGLRNFCAGRVWGNVCPNEANMPANTGSTMLTHSKWHVFQSSWLIWVGNCKNWLRSRACIKTCIYIFYDKLVHISYFDLPTDQRCKLCRKLGRSFQVGLGTSSRILRGSPAFFLSWVGILLELTSFWIFLSQFAWFSTFLGRFWSFLGKFLTFSNRIFQ